MGQVKMYFQFKLLKITHHKEIVEKITLKYQLVFGNLEQLTAKNYDQYLFLLYIYILDFYPLS